MATHSKLMKFSFRLSKSQDDRTFNWNIFQAQSLLFLCIVKLSDKNGSAISAVYTNTEAETCSSNKNEL